MGRFIGNLLSPSQFGLIPGRHIHTCIALTSDAINVLNMGSTGDMALKINITKAFDTVSWRVLVQVLRCMRFSGRFVDMIWGILSSARLSGLINGAPHGYFACLCWGYT